MCLGPGDPNRPFLTIIICEGAERASLVLESTSAGQLVDSNTGLCVTLAGGVREPGALLNLSKCLPKYPTSAVTVEGKEKMTGFSVGSVTVESESVSVRDSVSGKEGMSGGVGGVRRRALQVDFIAADHQVFMMTADGNQINKNRKINQNYFLLIIDY